MNRVAIGVILAILFLIVIVEGVFIFNMKKELAPPKPAVEDLYRPPVQAAPVPKTQAPSPYRFGAVSPGLSGGFSAPGWQDDSARDPFEEMDRIHNMMNKMFDDSLNRMNVAGGRGFSFEPDVDLEETPEAYLAKLDLPGIDKDKLDIKASGGQLTISGQRSMENDTDSGGIRRMERSFGSFTRSFPLPPDADTDAMTVDSKNGVVTVKLPKKNVKTAKAA